MCSFPEKTSLGYASMLTHDDSERDNSHCFSHLQKQGSGLFSQYLTRILFNFMSQLMLCTAGESTTIWLADTAFHALRTLPIPESTATAINWNHNSVTCL